jgi:DNA-binding transcriptional MerR regulator
MFQHRTDTLGTPAWFLEALMLRPEAFTSKQVSRLSGLSTRVLHYWDEENVYAASYKDDRPRAPYRRIYSFRDLVSLRTLATLRKEHNVQVSELRRVGTYLRETYPDLDDPWAALRFGVVNRRVVFRDPESHEWLEASGQHVLQIDVGLIALEAAKEASELLRRQPEDVGRVVQHRHVLRNAWRLAGTRIPTAAIWHFHEDGAETWEILREYPDLQEADIVAAIKKEQELRGIIAA